VIIIDGHLIFSNEELLNLIDLKVYVDADDDVRLSRKVIKQMKVKREGFAVRDFLDKYESIEKPSFEKHIEPNKKYADIVIPNYGFSLDPLNVEKQLIAMPVINLMVKEIERRMNAT
jgi:uridine kinase